MTKQDYEKYLKIMADYEGYWHKDKNDLYVFNNPKDIPEEALEAAEMLNESSIAGLKDWDNFIDMYGNQKIVGN